jgi:hypothetical protein
VRQAPDTPALSIAIVLFAGMPQFQGVPHYATTGWASPPPQQQPSAPVQTEASDSTSDNIFYAIVALLPELGPKHLLWVKGEV